LMNQKTESVTGLTKGIEGLMKKNKVDYIKGWGKFASKNQVEIDLIEGGT
jgi:dihydrolipoamide dehydrogenase